MSHTRLPPFGRAWLETVLVFFRVWLFDMLALFGALGVTRELAASPPDSAGAGACAFQ